MEEEEEMSYKLFIVCNINRSHGGMAWIKYNCVTKNAYYKKGSCLDLGLGGNMKQGTGQKEENRGYVGSTSYNFRISFEKRKQKERKNTLCTAFKSKIKEMLDSCSNEQVKENIEYEQQKITTKRKRFENIK